MKTYRFGLITALALGGLLALSSIAMAQDATKKGRKGGMSVERQLERMKTELALKDEQEPKVKEVLEESTKKMQEIRSDSALAQDERREKVQAAMAARDKKLKEILTSEQYTKWEKLRDEMRPGRGASGAPGNEKKADDSKKKE